MSNRGQWVTIVSGLPRSGTSMMMRMLEAGGLPVIVDHLRRPDDDNPAGYYEFEPAKQTKANALWLNEAPGKAVKMVYRLLYDLPPTFSYRVLFMRRKLDEVLVSQKTMLERHGKNDDVDAQEMASFFSKELARFEEWIQVQPHFSMLEVDYNRMLAEADVVVSEVVDFLEGDLDSDAMCEVVDTNLYRNRR